MSADAVTTALVTTLGKSDSFLGRVLGPLADGADYLSDKIRFARWKASIDTLEKANKIARERGLTNGNLGIRFLAPWLEGASLQPDDADDLSLLWASLLVGATQRTEPEDLVFLDVLKKIGEKEARLIKWLGARLPLSQIEDYLLGGVETRNYDHILNPFVASLAKRKLLLKFPKNGAEPEAAARRAFRKAANKYPIYPEAFAISMAAHFSYSEGFGSPYDSECDGVSFDVLRYLGVVESQEARAWRDMTTGEIVHEEPWDDGDEEWWVWGVTVVKPTKFGAKLIGRCIYPNGQLPF